jgi:hypothetical protein
MKKSQKLEYRGYFFAVIGIFAFIIFKTDPQIYAMRTCAALAFLLGIWDIFDSMRYAKKEKIAKRRYIVSKQIKEDFKEQNGRKSDSAAENEKSPHDADHR